MNILILLILGLCLGSFINAFVFRLHEKNNKKYSKVNLSILNGRSICPNCKHELGPPDLIPLFSWLFLKGKCRYCFAPISAQYPLVELITAILFLLSYVYWPYSFETSGVVLLCFWYVLLTGLISLALYDFKWLLLPNKLVLWMTIIWSLGLLIVNLVLNRYYMHIIICLVSGLIIFGFFYLIFIISQGKWIGGGDVKIGFLLGLIVATPINSLLVIFLASLLGTFYSLPSIVNKKRKINSHIPFGPFLILATILVFLFGARLLSWYSSINL